MATVREKLTATTKDKLQAAKKWIQDHPDAANMLRMVDNYMTQKRAMGEQFKMPEEHAKLWPFVDVYGEKLAKFTAFVKSLRDEAKIQSDRYKDLHEFYRTLITRLTQQQRRDRSRRALNWFEKNYPTAPYPNKMDWLLSVEGAWGKRRMDMMKQHQLKSDSGRLNTDEREVLLEEFWNEIDAEIEAGKLPPYKGPLGKPGKRRAA